MFNKVVVLLIVSFSSVLSHVDKVDESNYLVNRITDCFFINDDVERVELVCDNISGNSAKDSCYSSLFEAESQEINRWKIKYLQIGQCRSEVFNASQLYEIKKIFPNVADLNLSFLETYHIQCDAQPSANYSDLKVLNISHNKIGLRRDTRTTIDFFWGDFDVLDISFNHLNYITETGINFAGNISTLNLSYNSISYLHPSFLKSVRELRVIDLRNNQLGNVDENLLLPAFNTLQEIHLQNNQIKFLIGNYIWAPKHLVYLNLSGNQIENYNSIWYNHFHHNLQCLDLSHNKIEHIVIDYEMGKMLNSLDLSYNGLRTFNCSYEKSSALNVLNLEGNNLDKLDTITPLNFPNLTTIAISKNRFDCEYAKRFAQQWMNIRVIGDLCDQKINKDEPTNHWILYVIISLVGSTIAITAISHRFVRYKRPSAKKQEIIENVNIQCRSTDQYEQPLPFVEPIYHEIDYGATSAPNSSHTNTQYDHLTHDPMPLSPIRLHYDNLNKGNNGHWQRPTR